MVRWKKFDFKIKYLSISANCFEHTLNCGLPIQKNFISIPGNKFCKRLKEFLHFIWKTFFDNLHFIARKERKVNAHNFDFGKSQFLFGKRLL